MIFDRLGYFAPAISGGKLFSWSLPFSWSLQFSVDDSNGDFSWRGANENDSVYNNN